MDNTDRPLLVPALMAAFAVAATGFVPGLAPAMAGSDAADDGAMTFSGSEQPVEDTWITAKVKADLLVDPDTKGLAVDVDTKDGAVTLTGALDTRAQVDKAVAMARAIKGVKSVDADGLRVKPQDKAVSEP